MHRYICQAIYIISSFFASPCFARYNEDIRLDHEFGVGGLGFLLLGIAFIGSIIMFIKYEVEAGRGGSAIAIVAGFIVACLIWPGIFFVFFALFAIGFAISAFKSNP